MGRPLNKKYFGNLNVGTGGYTPVPGGNIGGDDGIGGEGVASAAVSGGSYTTRPTFTFTAPTIPGGVTATATITSRAKTATVGGPITIAYLNGEVVSSIGGTTWTVTKEAEQSVTIASTNNGGPGGTARIVLTAPITAAKGANFLTANNISGCGLATSTQYYILDGGTGTTFTITDSYDNAVAGTPMTLGSTGSATHGGVGIGSVYAPVASVTVANKGDFPYADGALVTSAQATTSTTGSGAGLTIAINAYEAKATVITEKGSGYVSAPTAATGPTQSVSLGTVTLTTDSGGKDGNNLNVDTNQDNAIIIHAKTTSGGTVQIGDIQAQKTSRRYKVKTNDGVAVCKLVASNTPAFGEAYILATDHTGASYWVTKLTAHRATVIPRGDGTPDFPAIGTGYNSEVQAQHVGWTFGTAHATSGLAIGTVKIENA
jgi:hypothetical protein